MYAYVLNTHVCTHPPTHTHTHTHTHVIYLYENLGTKYWELLPQPEDFVLKRRSFENSAAGKKLTTNETDLKRRSDPFCGNVSSTKGKNFVTRCETLLAISR